MKPRLMGPVLLALAAGLALGPGPALAQAGSGPVAVLSVEITGDAPPELRTQLQRSLAGGLGAGGASVVGPADVKSALEQRPELVGCTSTTCLAEIGELVAAKRFVKARVDAAGSTYLIELELLSAEAEGAVISRVERDCTVCSIMEANNSMSEAARDLLRAKDVESVPLLVNSSPSGATVAVDGVDVGRTPFEGELGPGEHQVSVSLDGYADSYRTVEVEARGSAQPVEIELTLTSEKALVDQVTTERPFKTLKWVAGGGSVAALTTGIVLLSIDGNEVDCGRTEPQTQCPERRETTAVGIASLGLGAALAGVTAWMFVRDAGEESATHERPTAVIVPTRGGGAAVVSLRF